MKFLNKKIIIFLISIFLLLFIFFSIFKIYNNVDFKEKSKNFICNQFIPILVDTSSKIINSTAFKGNDFCNYIYNDYNVKFLPETQFANFNFKIFNLNDNYIFNHFYLETYKDNLILIEEYGRIRYSNNNFINSENKFNYNFLDIQSNIETIITNGKILDSLIHQDKIFISYYSGKDCQRMGVAYAKLNYKKLIFHNLKLFKECKSKNSPMNGGRLNNFIHNNVNALLLTTSMNSKKDNNFKAQEDNSIYGKILFININTGNYEIFAKGFRNPQGLYSNNKLILTSEHGPRGGDEINNILYGGNYGWPISSYGEPYGTGFRERNKEYLLENFYKKNHYKLGFIEPVYSYIPSIGASEIIKIPGRLHPKWKDNFLLSSLSGHSLFRLLFDKDFNKVIYSEKIYIGYRIRDLKYDSINNVILLAMENFGQIGILIPDNM